MIEGERNLENLSLDDFHKEIIRSSPGFDYDNPLLFLELKALRSFHTELIPDWIKNRGYNPETDPQTIVLGQKQELIDWRERHGLKSEEFVIEPSSFGYHIDIYGDDVLTLTGAEKNKLNEKEYSQKFAKRMNFKRFTN